MWSRDVPQKNWARSVQPFYVYWIQINKQTNKHPDKQNLYIDI